MGVTVTQLYGYFCFDEAMLIRQLHQQTTLFFIMFPQFVLLLGRLQSKYSLVINMRLHAISHQARLEVLCICMHV